VRDKVDFFYLRHASPEDIETPISTMPIILLACCKDDSEQSNDKVSSSAIESAPAPLLSELETNIDSLGNVMLNEFISRELNISSNTSQTISEASSVHDIFSEDHRKQRHQHQDGTSLNHTSVGFQGKAIELMLFSKI